MGGPWPSMPVTARTGYVLLVPVSRWPQGLHSRLGFPLLPVAWWYWCGSRRQQDYGREANERHEEGFPGKPH